MLNISKLVKKYGNTTILNELSFSVPQGQVTALIGPSGSGKSTILRCINGLEKHDSGIIELKNIKSHQIGMVFQHFYLFNNMTLLENLTYAPTNVLKVTKKSALELAEHWLKKVNLLQLKDCYPKSLSGGQKQRAAIARSLCMEPRILLLDEPTSALDPENVKEVQDVIKALAHTGITLLIATHVMKFAQSIADRVIFIDHGAIVEDTEANAFFKSPTTSRASDFLNTIVYS